MNEKVGGALREVAPGPSREPDLSALRLEAQSRRARRQTRRWVVIGAPAMVLGFILAAAFVRDDPGVIEPLSAGITTTLPTAGLETGSEERSGVGSGAGEDPTEAFWGLLTNSAAVGGASEVEYFTTVDELGSTADVVVYGRVEDVVVDAQVAGLQPSGSVDSMPDALVLRFLFTSESMVLDDGGLVRNSQPEFEITVPLDVNETPEALRARFADAVSESDGIFVLRSKEVLAQRTGASDLSEYYGRFRLVSSAGALSSRDGLAVLPLAGQMYPELLADLGDSSLADVFARIADAYAER